MNEPARNRLILELCQGASDPNTIRAAADYARMLDLDLHCLFIEDEALLAWSEAGFAREIRLPTYHWSAVSADSVVRDLQHAAARTRRLLSDYLPDIGAAARFQVMRGDPAECIAGLCRCGDVVVVSEPVAPSQRATRGVQRLRSGAHASAASVLLLPARPVGASGSIAVMADDADDAALDVACPIALAANALLLVLLPADVSAAARERLASRVRQAGLPAERLSVHTVPHRSAHDLMRAAGDTPVRLVILARRSEADERRLAADLVTTAHVPVLLIEPAPAA
ncbi:MAG: hypothetical protein U1E70_11855 [Acetobacteraceae bacterium]